MGMLKRLYDWVMGWADSPYGTPALFLLALAESSFFPIPPDILLMALAIAKPRRALFYAGVCTGGSVLGGMIGYLIGLEFYELMGRHIIEFYGVSDEFDYVGSQYQANAFVAVAIAGFTPIPYKVFTIAAGVFRLKGSGRAAIGYGSFPKSSTFSYCGIRGPVWAAHCSVSPP